MSSQRPPAGQAPIGTPAPSPALLTLPAPRHLHEFLARSQHLHFGFFEAAGDSLAQAQDRLILRSARFLLRDSNVVDIGCGLGGTAHLLAGLGHRVVGLDPCASSIAYARARAVSPRAQFLHGGLAAFVARARGARFDALFLTEILSQFTDLSAAFTQCRALLRPGGLVLVHEVVRNPAAPVGQEYFHPRGAMRSAADAAGFDLVEIRDATNRTAPTLSRLLRALAERRAELLRFFAPVRPEIVSECEAFETHLRAVELAFSRQELFFETCVLRSSARFGSDSVTLRARPAVVPVRREPAS